VTPAGLPEPDATGSGRSSTAAARAIALVEAARDDPAGRLRLVERTYLGPYGRAPRHRPFRRAALSFMGWQIRRGLLEPLTGTRPGSPWWRTVNERLLRDQCEAVARSGGAGGEPSSPTIEPWMRFISRPTARTWYHAHNGSIVAAYVQHRDLAEQENEAERFFLNVVLVRVLFAHALVSAPRLALGRLAPFGWMLGDPRLGAAGLFLSLGRVLPGRYPAPEAVDAYIGMENGLARLLDYGVITARLQQLYAWSARELDQPGLLPLIQEGAPVYAWPHEARHVWHTDRPSPAVRLLRQATSP
jgi:hypothetical protein